MVFQLLRPNVSVVVLCCCNNMFKVFKLQHPNFSAVIPFFSVGSWGQGELGGGVSQWQALVLGPARFWGEAGSMR